MCEPLPGDPGGKLEIRHLAIAAVLAAFLLTPRALIGPLRHWDEAWYAQVSREMLEESSWLTVRWNGAPWFHKPPLTFWATAGLYQILGISEFSARLFSLICGIGLVILVTAFAGRWLAPRYGLFAGLSLLAIPEFARYAARGQIDVPLSLAITAALTAFWMAQDRPGWFWASGIALGLAILTKGAAAGLILLIQLAYGVVRGDLRFIRAKQWWGGLALAIVIAFPWHIHQVLTHGAAFLEQYGARHLLQLFIDIYPETESAPAPYMYYLDFLWRKQAPWGWAILALLAALAIVALARRRDRKVVFIACWACTIPLVLSLSWAKWSWYLMPMYPAIALGMTLLLWNWSAARHHSKLALAMAFLMALGVASEPYWSPPAENFEGEIKSLGPTISDRIPSSGAIVTLQTTSARQSIYPIAVRFYVQRTVHAVEGEERLVEMCERAGNVVFVLMHASILDRFQNSSEVVQSLDIYEVDRAGAVVFVQIASRGMTNPHAARKSASSRATR